MAKAKPARNPAKIIAIYNQKGGCGKTATTMQLAGGLALRGYNTLVVDMDTQGTALRWSAQALDDAPFPATVISLAATRGKMIKEIEKLVTNYDYILIDCPPAIESQVPWAALNIADLGLIPVIPLMDNVWASAEAKELGLRAQEENPDLRLAYMHSMVRRGRIFQNCMEIIEKDEDIPLLKSYLSMRNAFPESQAFGMTVHSLPKVAPAINEVESLVDEVIKLVGAPN